MIDRRQAIKAAAAAIPVKAAVRAQAGPQEQLKRTNLMSQDLPRLDGPDLVVTVQELEYAPGGSSEAHRHNGCTFVYVQMFYEPPLHLHAVSRNASQTAPAKFLVFRVIEKGKPGTVPAK